MPLDISQDSAAFDPARPSVLVVHDDEAMLGVLRNFLSGHFNVSSAASGPDALTILLRNSKFDAVIARLEMTPMSGIDFVGIARRQGCKLGFVLLSEGQIESAFPQLRRHRVLHVVACAKPFDFDDLLVTVENIIRPKGAFGLRRYMREPMQIRERTIRSAADKTATVDDALRFFANYRRYEEDLNVIRLGFEELINNAIFHAFRHEDGGEKYRAGFFETLAPGELIHVEFGRDNWNLGCCVTDNRGALDPDTVLAKLERQLTLRGLMDESGRGIHLTRTLSDNMIINIDVGRRTQFVLLFAHRAAPRCKPFHLNIFSPKAARTDTPAEPALR